MLKPYLNQIIAGHDLDTRQAEEAMDIIMTGQATPAQIGGFLVALRMKGESVDEITGAARAMRRVVNRVNPNNNGESLIDTAGTGGDGSHSFNISTAAAFVIAGAGRKVAKHGNRAASSRCGSADVLGSLGVNLDLSSDQVGQCIDEVGIGFMFAPKFHPAMKHAIGPRRELGLRTIFNVLGPLTNPAQATHQLIGVFDPALTEPMAEVLGALGLKAAMVVHGYGGLDELSTGGANRVSRMIDGEVETFDFDPTELGLLKAHNGDLAGGDPEENAQKMVRLLTQDENGPLTDVILLNAAAGLALDHGDLELGLAEAKESLASGAALGKLDQLIETSQRLSIVQ